MIFGFPRIYAYLAAGAAVLALVGGIYAKGVMDAKEAERAREAREAADTHERINNADTGSGNTDDDREWLHNRGR